MWGTRVFCLSFGMLLGLLGCSTTDSTVQDAGTSTGTGMGDDAAEPILDGGGEVATSPDGAALCPVGACNYQTGEGCPANMTCEPAEQDAGTVPGCASAGSAATGSTCATSTDCSRGMVCAGGACRKICCGEPRQLKDFNSCPSGEHCLLGFQVKLSSGAIVDTGAYLCFPVNDCNALDPSSCTATNPGTTCQIADETGATACLSDGTAGPTDNCGCKSDGGCTRCMGGSLCVSNGCRRLCKAVPGGGEPSCPETEGRCVHFARDPDGVGECSPI